MKPNKFPDQCLQWLANREGSVRRPFVHGSGRPAGDVIETDLTEKLRNLAASIHKDESFRPSIVLLAGGAGNGKSEALELFLTELASLGSNEKQTVEGMRTKFASHERAVDLTLGEMFGREERPKDKVRVVQDASEGDESRERAGKLLLRDMKGALEGKWTFLCCVNRGILETTRYEALKLDEASEIVSLLNVCIKTLDRSSSNIACWPLPGGQKTYVWPMDIESLVASETSPVTKVFLSALEPSKWSEGVLNLKSACPLATNREKLFDDNNRLALSILLHGHEVATASLWSFRNLFSLTGFLLSGGSILREDEAPSELSARLGVADTNLSIDELTFTRLDRLRACYEQQLFPLLPSSNWFFKSVENDFIGLPRLVALAKYLKQVDEYRPKFSIEKTLYADWTAWLDPARERSKPIEAAFNLSTRAGVKKFEEKLSQIEIQALNCIADCEEEISKDLVGQGSHREDRFRIGKSLVWFLRRLAATFVKRSLGVKESQPEKDSRIGEIHDFLSRCKSEDALQKEAELLEDLFSRDSMSNSSYVVRVDHVIGQPTMESAALVIAEAPEIRVQGLPQEDLLRPLSYYREFLIISGGDGGEVKVPYDFSLFQRLRAMERSILHGSVDPMLRGVLDQAKVALDGFAVRGWGNQAVKVLVGEGPDDKKTITVRPSGVLKVR